MDIIDAVLECISLDSFKINVSSNSFKMLLKIFINLTNSDLLTNYLKFFFKKLWFFILVVFASFMVSWNMNRFPLFVNGQDNQQLLFSEVSLNTSPQKELS